MPFLATVYRVLIASPGDVNDERDVVERAIIDWNDEHSRDREVVFLPVRWERAPSRGGVAGQDAINEDLVDTSDALVGVFWARIGSKTQRDESGSIEEIRRFAVSEKPYGLFFKDAPIPLNHDAEQLAALRVFKKEVHSFDSDLRGLTQDFGPPDQLARLVARFLTDTLRRLLGPAESVPQHPGTNRLRLSSGAEEVLKAATRAAIQFGDARAATISKYSDPATQPMSDAAFQSAVEQLTRRGLIAIESRQGSSRLVARISDEALDHGLRGVTTNFDHARQRIREAICTLSPTSVETVAELLNLPDLLVRHVAETLASDGMLTVERFVDVTRLRKPSSELCNWDQSRPRKACLVLSHFGPIQGDNLGYVSVGVDFLNEGEYIARDMKITKDLGDGFEPEPESFIDQEIPPGKTSRGLGFRVKGPTKDETNSWIPGQKLELRLKVTFRDGLGQRDEAIFSVRMHNEAGLWKPVEDRAAARLSPICQFARPESS